MRAIYPSLRFSFVLYRSFLCFWSFRKGVDSFTIKLHCFEASAFTATVTQEAKIVAAHLGTAYNLYFFDKWAVKQEAFFQHRYHSLLCAQ